MTTRSYDDRVPGVEVESRDRLLCRSNTWTGRVFGVQCEETVVLEDVRPGEKGDGTASVERFEVSVIDGVLDLRFLPEVGVPKIAALEIESVVR